jgi:hypothetical protein
MRSEGHTFHKLRKTAGLYQGIALAMPDAACSVDPFRGWPCTSDLFPCENSHAFGHYPTEQCSAQAYFPCTRQRRNA